MKSFKTLATAFCLVALCFVAVPKATADDWNRETVVTFSGPVEVPGVGAQILPAATSFRFSARTKVTSIPPS